jgi:hypothetical protein
MQVQVWIIPSFFFGERGGGGLIVFWVQVQVIGQIIHDICFEFC